MKARPPQTNCQQEPGYPEHETVVYSIRYRDLTVHRPRPRCAIEAPHVITECGEWRHAMATMIDDDPMGGTRMLGCVILALLGVVIVVLAAVYAG